MPSPSSTRFLHFLVSIGWLLAALPQPTRAQSTVAEAFPAPDPCLADARCKQLADRGQAEYQAQQHEAALGSFRAAFALQPVPWLLFNMGRIHQKQGRTEEALAAYRPFLQQSQAADEAAQRAKARAFVEQVERERATQAVAAIPTTSPPPKKKLIYKKWWFWTALGAVVVTGSLAIILGTQVDPRPVPMTLVDFRGKI